MDCRQASEALSEYIDGRLCVEDTAAIAAHLEGCLACRRLEADLRGTVELLGGLETKQPPADFAEGIAARLERKMLLDAPAEAPRRRIIPWPAAGFGLAAAAALIVAVYVRYMPEGPSPAQAPAAVAVGEKKAQAEAEVAGPAERREMRRADAPAAGIALERDKDFSDRAAAKGAVAGAASETDAAVKSRGADYLSAKGELQAADGKMDAFASTAAPPAPAEKTQSLGYVSGRAEIASKAGSAGRPQQSVSDASGEEGVRAQATLGVGVAAEVAEKANEAAQPVDMSGSNLAQIAKPEGGDAVTPAAGEPLVLTVRTEGDALVMAMKLLSLLPGEDGNTAPTEAGPDTIRAAALARKAEPVEVSADKVVIDVLLDAAAARAICARLTPSRAVSAAAPVPAAVAKAVTPSAPAEQAAAPSPNALAEARNRQMHAAATAPTAGPVRVRFVLERAAPAAEPAK